MSIAGVSKGTSEYIVAEIGVGMNQSLSEAHLSSWAGSVPGTTKVLAGDKVVKQQNRRRLPG